MQPSAPSATAFTMSLPRRTPPSQMTAMESPTASFTGATSSMGGGAPSSWRPPWFDRAMPSTPASTAEPGVVDGLDALDHDGTVPVGPEPLDVRPRQRRIELLADVARQRHRTAAVARDVGERDRIGPGERQRPPRVQRTVDQRPRPELRRHREPDAHVSLSSTEHRGVDRDHDSLVAARRGPLQHVLHQAAITPHVDLEPLRSIGGRRHLLDRTRAHGRQRVRQVRRPPPLVRRRAHRRGRRCG